MKRALVFAVIAVLVLAAVAGAAFKIGQAASNDEVTVARLKEQVADSDTELVAVKREALTLQIKLKNLQAETSERTKAVNAVKEVYQFPDIEARMAAIKLSFNDLQREVAEGKHPGLALTAAYQELRQVFDHPEFDRLVRVEHTRDQ